MRHRYVCSDSIKYGGEPCMSMEGRELDQAIVTRVLSALKQPPIEILKQALAEARQSEQVRANNVEAEKQRLERDERLVRKQFDNCDPAYHLVFHDLQARLNKVLEEKRKFEERILSEQLSSTTNGSEKEIEELCRLAAEIPTIWSHPMVTNHERKEIIRCLVEQVVVDRTKDKIAATIHWTTGKQTCFHLYRRAAKYSQLVKELHAQGCNSREIIEKLQRGDNSTAQAMPLHLESLYKVYKRLGLKPHSKPSWFKPLQEEAVQLRDEGKTCQQISNLFNSRGLKTLSGRPWSWKLVFNLVNSVPRKPDPLKDIHREAFRDAHSRGLNFAQIAREFNERGIPRHNKRQWHKEATRRTWLALRKSGGESAKE